MNHANLAHARLYKTNLSKARLNDVDLRHSQFLPRTDQRHPPTMQRANFGGSKLIGVHFVRFDLSYANFAGAELRGCYFEHSNLVGTNFSGANMESLFPVGGTVMRHVKLMDANFTGTNLRHADMSFANLSQALLITADLTRTDLSFSNLSGANLEGSRLVNTTLRGAKLDGARVYGASAWDVDLTDCSQLNLAITQDERNFVTVDNLEVAQFIYLILNNSKIRGALDAFASRVVLILGRFTPQRKAVLEAIREAVRKCGLVPVLFDFEKPNTRDTIETISTLAHIAKCVIADLTDAKSVLQELQRIVPTLPSVPVMPVLLHEQFEPGMLDHLHAFQSVMPTYRYTTQDELLATIRDYILRRLDM